MKMSMEIGNSIVIDVGNLLQWYKNQMFLLLEYNQQLVGANTIRYGDNYNKYLEESVRQVVEILSEFPQEFLSRLQSKPNLKLIFGMKESTFLPDTKIELEKTWKEFALHIYFNIIKQTKFDSTVLEYILIRILDDGIVMASERLNGINISGW